MRLKTIGAAPGLGLCAVLLCGAAQAGTGPASCAAYAQDLAAMAGADAALRARQDLLAAPDDRGQGRRRDQLALVERSNGARLKALLADCGWPLRGVHGEQAGKDAWRLVRQAGEDLAWQKTVAQHLEQAVLRGEAPGRELAQLDDRIAVAEGRPQRYGTRMRQVDACRWFLTRWTTGTGWSSAVHSSGCRRWKSRKPWRTAWSSTKTARRRTPRSPPSQYK